MTDPSISPDKSRLRRELRRARQAVPEALRREAGRMVLRQALRARLLAPRRRIGLYMPAKGEIDVLPLLNRALWLGIHCYLPVVPGHRSRRLWFARLGDGPHWSLNRFDIPEYGQQLRKIRAAALDILFLPMLGFDERGYRIGMGGGFYDASLAYLQHRHVWRRPRLVGVAFEAQKQARLPTEAWDVPLDMVLTERRIYRFRPQ
jgi:5-formyltetrahydrofolate cyclo-ligase